MKQFTRIDKLNIIEKMILLLVIEKADFLCETAYLAITELFGESITELFAEKNTFGIPSGILISQDSLKELFPKIEALAQEFDGDTKQFVWWSDYTLEESRELRVKTLKALKKEYEEV